MLPVPKVLYDTLQVLRRVFLQVAFHISREDSAQHFGSPLQVLVQATLLTPYLVIRGRKRDQRDTHNEENNEPDAEQSHGASPPSEVGRKFHRTATGGSLILPVLERRQLVFVLLLLSANNFLFQKTPGQVPAPHAECDGQAEHQGSEGNSEGNQHGLFCQTQFFKNDGQYENNDDAAESEAQNPG
jgi:hypothetical protein